MPYSETITAERQHQCKNLVEDHVHGSASGFINEQRYEAFAYPYGEYFYDDNIAPISLKVIWDWDKIDAEFPDGFDELAEWEKITWARKNNLEPEYKEALEHLFVSDWLAGCLKEKGEMVGNVFGYNIWGRTTSGQAIKLDGVIQEIAAESQMYSVKPGGDIAR